MRTADEVVATLQNESIEPTDVQLNSAAPDSPAMRAEDHIPVLDGIRGLAVLLVIVHHFGFGTDPNYPRWAGRMLSHLVSLGWTGVDLFFVLSGFLITGILLDAKGSAHYFRNFYARRVLRIFPLYYGVLLLTFLVLPLLGWGVLGQPREQVWAWLYGVNWFGLVQENWKSRNWFVILNPFQFVFVHFWSLAIEEQFYLVWPLLVWLCSRRALAALCVFLIGLALACRVGLMWAGCDGLGLPYQFTLCRADALAMGAVLAVVARGPGGLAAFLRPARWVVGICGGLLAGMFAYNGLQRETLATPTVGFTVVDSFFAAILVLCLVASPGNRWTPWLDNGVMRFFGRYSYGIYVYQGLLVGILTSAGCWISVDWLTRHTGHYLTSVFLHTEASMLLILGVACLSWHIYEKQFLKLKRYFEYSGARGVVGAADSRAMSASDAAVAMVISGDSPRDAAA